MTSIIDKDAFATILSEKGDFETEDDETACRKLVNELSPEQQSTAAKSSYAYWLSTVEDDFCILLDRDELKVQFAMREARRHYIGANRDYEKALKGLQEAITYREEFKIDLIRLIRKAASLDEMDLTDDDKATVRRYRGYLEKEFENQMTVSGGLDKKDRAVAIRFSRKKPDTDMEAYLVGQVYGSERACAATEFYTLGKLEKFVAITEYADYNSSNAPPMLSLREMIVKTTCMYPERLHKMVVTDPPFWMRTLFTLLYPLLSQATKEKMVLTLGPAEKEKAVRELIDVESSLPMASTADWTMSYEGVDIQQYLDQHMHLTYIPIRSAIP